MVNLQAANLPIDRDREEVLSEREGFVLHGPGRPWTCAQNGPLLHRPVNVRSTNPELTGVPSAQEDKQLPTEAPTQRHHAPLLVELTDLWPWLPPKLLAPQACRLQDLRPGAGRGLLVLLAFGSNGRRRRASLHEDRCLLGGFYARERRRHVMAITVHGTVIWWPHVHSRVQRCRRARALAHSFAGLFDELLVDEAKLLAPNLDRLRHVFGLAALVIHHEVKPGVFVHLAVRPHAAARQEHLAEARSFFDLLHHFAAGPEQQPRHVGAVDALSAVDTPLGLRKARQQRTMLVGGHLAAARNGRRWNAV
mmetsp:Transcript_34694/g.95631  ORF Transcript_34694/g.95631 Transcript_34694/m.95631 type:complete len:308 (-) Transcript_34694:2978-3901(-)